MNGNWCDQAEIMESIAAQGCPRGCYEWELVRPGRDYGIYCRSGGALGDVMNGNWCDQAEIMESIAAQGRPRGCYEWKLVRPGRDHGIYRRSGAPEGML